MKRKDFITGLVTGGIAASGVIGSIKAVQGDFHPWFSPFGDKSYTPIENQEMKMVLLGTGNPLPSLTRSKPSQVILASGKAFLVDCGAGTVNRLLQAGVSPTQVDHVFFTHHHSDHNSGFINFLISRVNGDQMPGTDKPLHLYGPSNSRLIINKLMDHLQWDINLRIRQARNNPEGFKLVIHETDDGIVYDNDGLKITAFPVDHGIVKPAIGYTFENGEKKIVLSGDTRPCESVVEYSRNADILVHEAYSQRWIDLGIKKYPEKAKTAEGIKQYHSSVTEAAKVAQSAKVKHLVFTHLIPSPAPVWYFERHWAAGASDIFSEKISVGRDLERF